MLARARPEPLDVVLAVALALAAQIEIWLPEFAPGVSEPAGSRPLLTALSLALTLPLAYRRSLPLWSCVVVLGAACAEHLLTTPTEGLTALAAMLLSAYSVAAHGARLDATIGLALIVVSSAVVGREDFLFILVLLIGAWAGGTLAGRRTHQVADLESERLALLAEQQLAAERGALEERARIARELHDVVAHRVSMMVVQAQAADALLTTSPERARQAVRSVDEAGREALVELRSLLGLLRADPDSAPDAPALAPTPDLAEIDQLVDATQLAGLPVTLKWFGERRAVPPLIGLAAYRIVQESLTNTLKHGDSAPTTVRLCFNDDHLDVLVEDQGPGANGNSPGFGLAGMRERVTFVGGTLTVGPADGGGFAVHATLPIEASR